MIKKCGFCCQLRLITTRKRFCESCRERTKELRRKRRLEFTRKYRSTPEYKAKRKEQVKAKLKSNPHLLLIKRIRNRIYTFLRLRGMVRLKSTKQIIGCSYEDLKRHIEDQFQPGMSWENIGQWHIDHEKPLASAKTREEILKLNHFSNLRPLWALDNLRKGTKHGVI